MDSPPTVLVLTTAHGPVDGRILHKQAASMAAAGYRVVLLAPDRPGAETVVSSLGVEFRPLRGGPTRLARIWRLREVAAELWRRRATADVWHVHDPELLLLCVPLRALIARRTKLVYDVHEDYAAAVLQRPWIAPRLRRLVSIVTRTVEHVFATGTQLVIGATPGISANFADTGRRPVVTVRNYPVSRAAAAATSNPDIPGRRQGMIRCVYVGGLTRVRGIPQMVSAMHLLESEQIELVLAGPFDSDSFRQEVLADAPDSVHWCGVLPFDDVPQLLEASDIGMLCLLPEPNHIESLPTKLFEYLGSGLPVIASDFASWRPLVAGAGVGLQIDPEQPDSIAAAILRLSGDGDLRREMGTRGRRQALSEYTWAREAQRLMQAYDAMLGRPAGIGHNDSADR